MGHLETDEGKNMTCIKNELNLIWLKVKNKIKRQGITTKYIHDTSLSHKLKSRKQGRKKNSISTLF